MNMIGGPPDGDIGHSALSQANAYSGTAAYGANAGAYGLPRDGALRHAGLVRA